MASKGKQDKNGFWPFSGLPIFSEVTSMQAKMKCSNCGTEISNLSMSWSKQWLWVLIFLPLGLLPLFTLYRDSLFGKPDFRSELVLTVDRVDSSGGRVTAIATVENTGEHTWDGVNVEIEYYDEAGVFIDEAGDYLRSSLKPGDKEHFKLVLFSDEDFSSHTHQAKVTDARRDRF